MNDFIFQSKKQNGQNAVGQLAECVSLKRRVGNCIVKAFSWEPKAQPAQWWTRCNRELISL